MTGRPALGAELSPHAVPQERQRRPTCGRRHQQTRPAAVTQERRRSFVFPKLPPCHVLSAGTLIIGGVLPGVTWGVPGGSR